MHQPQPNHVDAKQRMAPSAKYVCGSTTWAPAMNRCQCAERRSAVKSWHCRARLSAQAPWCDGHGAAHAKWSLSLK
eukprot:9114533-Alexandrium_andersonii.AAC.1